MSLMNWIPTTEDLEINEAIKFMLNERKEKEEEELYQEECRKNNINPITGLPNGMHWNGSYNRYS